jgi:hypothetical protein
MTLALNIHEYAALYGDTAGFDADVKANKVDQERRVTKWRETMRKRTPRVLGGDRRHYDKSKTAATERAAQAEQRKAALRAEIDALLNRGRTLRTEDETNNGSK